MNEVEIYLSNDNQIEVSVQFDKDTVWLSQKQMADLFGKDSDTIGLHLKNIYAEQELLEGATTELFSVVQMEGKREITRKIKYYNLDAILSVGYRVNSKRGTQFRQWATQRLKDYLVKGYAINQKHLSENHYHYRRINENAANNHDFQYSLTVFDWVGLPKHSQFLRGLINKFQV